MKIEEYLRERNKLVTRKKLYAFLGYFICGIFLSSFFVIPAVVMLTLGLAKSEVAYIFLIGVYWFIVSKFRFLFKKFDGLFEKKTGIKLGLGRMFGKAI